MKKVFTVLVLLIGCAFEVNAEVITSAQAGSWNDPATWGCDNSSCIPGPDDDVTVEHAITSSGDVTVNTLAFSTEWGPTQGHGQLTVASGTFSVLAGTITFGGNDQSTQSLTVESGATFSTTRDIKWNKAATITVNGIFAADGFDVSDGNNGNFNVGTTGSATFAGQINITSGPHNFNIDGEFQANSLKMSGSANFNVSDDGNAEIINNVEMTNGNLEVDGNMKIGGDLIMANGPRAVIDGSLAIAGTMDLAYEGMVSGSGSITAGSCKNSNCPPFSTPQPVTLLYFKATAQSNAVEISWASSKAWDFSHYELERSANGQDFSKIAEIDAAENSEVTETYAYTDQRPIAGTSYYRLKAVDIDGAFEYKGVEVVQFGGDSLKVYPNPSAKGIIYLDGVDADEQQRVELKDNSGRTVRTAVLGAEKSLSTAGLPAGLYVLLVQSSAGMQQTQVMIR